MLVYTAYERIKQQILENQQRQWDAMTDYWQWQLWYRESAFGEHEYDQEREAQRQGSMARGPVVGPAALSMNQQHSQLAHAQECPIAADTYSAHTQTEPVFLYWDRGMPARHEMHGPMGTHRADNNNVSQGGLHSATDTRERRSGAMLAKDCRRLRPSPVGESRLYSEHRQVCEQTLMSDGDGSLPETHRKVDSSLHRPSSPSTLRERSRLMTQRSKTSLNRLLNTVMDNATALSVPGSRCHRYAEEDGPCPPSTSPSAHSPKSPPRRALPVIRISRRAEFFVPDDDSDLDSEGTLEDPLANSVTKRILTPMDRVTPAQHDNDSEDSDQHGSNDEEDDQSGEFLTINQQDRHKPLAHPAGSVRRPSLLSELFMAEKLQTTQRKTIPKSTTDSMLSSTKSSRCPSAVNSDGEDSHSSLVPRSYLLAPHSFERQSPQSNQHRQRLHPFSEQHLVCTASRDEHLKSPLVRSKKSVFKKLDELVVVTSNEDDIDRTVCLMPPSSPGYHTEMSNQGSSLSLPCQATACTPVSDVPSTATIPAAKSATSSLNHPNQSNHTSLSTPAGTCCSHPTTATSTACAVASSTSKTTVKSNVSEAITATKASAGGVGLPNWAPTHVQDHARSFYGLFTSSVSRALSAAPVT
ncbi:hypothetical protein BGZ51_002547 [Haplosporangium sp. Z 767]|nr:hypothetical protein BGZ50_006074 [Haplosporangium sp. Z 11]KAF9185610.1 hypothetical protein BGZ51_002547 [Haplosporangium sp. Z 767]